MNPEFRAVLSAQEWDAVFMGLQELPLKVSLGAFTKLRSQLEGQKPVNTGESDGRPTKSADAPAGADSASSDGEAPAQASN